MSSCSATNFATVIAPAPACREMVRAGFCRTCCPAGADWARKKPVKASAEPLFIFKPFVTLGIRYGFTPTTNRESFISDHELGSSKVQRLRGARDNCSSLLKNHPVTSPLVVGIDLLRDKILSR